MIHQNRFTKFTFFNFILVSMLTWSCSKNSIETVSPSSGSGGNPGSPQSNTPNGVINSPIPNSVDVTSYVSGGTYDKLQTVGLDRSRKELLLRMPLGLNSFVTVSSGSFPNYPDIYFATEIDSSGTAYLTVHVPLKYVLRGVTSVASSRLPNGDPLPMIPSGELPGLALDLNSQNKVKFYLYIGVDMLGIYVESPFNPYIGLTFPIKNKAETKIMGYISTVPAKSNYQGGFFLSFLLPSEISSVLDQYVFSQ